MDRLLIGLPGGQACHFVGGGKRDESVRDFLLVTMSRWSHQLKQSGLNVTGGRIDTGAEMQRAKTAPEGHQANQHAKVTNAVDNERLVSCRRSRMSLKIEANQKPRANAHKFPEDEDHRQIARNDDAEH